MEMQYAPMGSLSWARDNNISLILLMYLIVWPLHVLCALMRFLMNTLPRPISSSSSAKLEAGAEAFCFPIKLLNVSPNAGGAGVETPRPPKPFVSQLTAVTFAIPKLGPHYAYTAFMILFHPLHASMFFNVSSPYPDLLRYVGYFEVFKLCWRHAVFFCMINLLYFQALVNFRIFFDETLGVVESPRNSVPLIGQPIRATMRAPQTFTLLRTF